MIKIITGATGEAHITPQQDAMWHRGLGADNGVFDSGDKFEYQVISNNLIRLSSGICAIQGRFASIDIGDTEDAIIENGSQGVTRYDLICAKISVSDAGYSSASIVTLKGTNGQEPTIPQGILDNGDTEAFLPLYKVTIESLAITNVEKLFSLIGGNDLIGDAWNGTKQYQVGDYAIYNNSLWKSLVSNTGVEPSESSTWHKVSVTSELGKSNDEPLNIKSNVVITNDKGGKVVCTDAWAINGIVNIELQVQISGTVSSGNDAWSGKISGEYEYNGKRYSIAPKQGVSFVAWSGGSVIMFLITSTIGAVRVGGGSSASGNHGGVGMYFATPLD